MKKWKIVVPLILIAVLAVALAACGGDGKKNNTPALSDAQKFIDAVNLLPPLDKVLKTDEADVLAAIAQYDALSQKDKDDANVVSKYNRLIQLRDKIEELKNVPEPPAGLSPAQNAFILAVNALPLLSTVTDFASAVSTKALLPAVDLLYEPLTASEVSHADVAAAKTTLENLRTKIAQLEAAGAEDTAATEAANAFMDKVKALPAASAVTNDNKAEVAPLVEAARAAYTALSPAAKLKPGVSDELAKLVILEEKLVSLSALTVNAATAAEFTAAWAQVTTAGVGTIVVTADISLNNTESAAAGTFMVNNASQHVTIKSGTPKRTVTIGTYSRFQVLNSGKITFENINVNLSSNTNYNNATNGPETAAINIHGVADEAGGAGAVITLIDCTFTSNATHSNSNSFFQANHNGSGSASADGNNCYGTFNIIRSTVSANYRPLGQSGNMACVVFNLIDATITCTTGSGNAFYRGVFNLYGTTTFSPAATGSTATVNNATLGTYPDWYTPPA